MLSRWFLVILFLCVSIASFSQEKKQKKSVFRDTLDNALDLSTFLIDMNGFIPIPFIITEPALGGAGGGLALIFLKRRPPQIDSVGKVRKVIRMPPDITGGGGMYTANNSWAIMALRSGSWVKSRLKYRIVGGYANVNLSYYRTLQDVEHEVEFNLKTVPLVGYLMKQFKGTYWSAGLQYTFLSTKVGFDPSSPALDFVENKELDSYVSIPGVLVEFDKRDNIFTPDKGIRFHFSTGFSDESFGSDYDYTTLSTFAYGYHPLSSKVVGGLRAGFQQVFGDAPFYLLPYVELRGIPIARYQGDMTSVVEAEVRWDFVPRWSLVGFGGTGKAFDSWSEFNSSEYRWSGGGGFRYLIARQFKIRMGVDLAHGPEQWAYYIVFGSSWLR